MAAPHIAGAALLLRENRVSSANAIKAALINTTDTVDWSNSMGWGFANLARSYSRKDSVWESFVEPCLGVFTDCPPGPNGIHWLRGSSSSGVVATLVWSRVVGPTGTRLHDLDLELYNQAGELLMRSNSQIDNVEQVYQLTPVDYVLKVKSRSATFSFGVTQQPFALVVSDRNVIVDEGPRVSANCSSPPSVISQASFEVVCSIQNIGALRVQAVGGNLILRSGQNELVRDPFDVGELTPGQTVVRRWNLIAPVNPGSYEVILGVGHTGFGELFPGYSFRYDVTVSPRPGCSVSLSTSSRSHPANSDSGSVTVTAASGCPWAASVNVPWISLITPTSGSGNGQVRYAVASNSGSARSSVITIGGQQFVVTQSGVSSSGLRFVAVSPCRVMDTRTGSGLTGAFGAPVIQGGSTRELPIPLGPCGIPAGAKAYSVNVTVVPDGPMLQYLTLWPTGEARPLASTLNSFDGKIVANAALVPAGTNGAVSIFVTERTHVIVDVNGYFRE